MTKKLTQKINPPKLMVSLSLTNGSFLNLTDIITLDFSKINNGIFIKNNSDENGDIISIKFSDVSNTTNIIELINNDNIFIEHDNISTLQLKKISSNPISMSILVN